MTRRTSAAPVDDSSGAVSVPATRPEGYGNDGRRKRPHQGE